MYGSGLHTLKKAWKNEQETTDSSWLFWGWNGSGEKTSLSL